MRDLTAQQIDELIDLVRTGLATSELRDYDDMAGTTCFFCDGSYLGIADLAPDGIEHESTCIITRARTLMAELDKGLTA